VPHHVRRPLEVDQGPQPRAARDRHDDAETQHQANSQPHVRRLGEPPNKRLGQGEECGILQDRKVCGDVDGEMAVDALRELGLFHAEMLPPLPGEVDGTALKGGHEAEGGVCGGNADEGCDCRGAEVVVGEDADVECEDGDFGEAEDEKVGDFANVEELFRNVRALLMGLFAASGATISPKVSSSPVTHQESLPNAVRPAASMLAWLTFNSRPGELTYLPNHHKRNVKHLLSLSASDTADLRARA
jgi:hypothetical protein